MLATPRLQFQKLFNYVQTNEETANHAVLLTNL